jgi:hypothetical protein
MRDTKGVVEDLNKLRAVLKRVMDCGGLDGQAFEASFILTQIVEQQQIQIDYLRDKIRELLLKDLKATDVKLDW